MAVVHDLVVAPQKTPLSGSVPLVADPKIAQLALLCAALAEGPSEVRWRERGAEVETTLAALRSLGIAFTEEARGVRVQGKGILGWQCPRDSIDCGGSASLLAALAGALVSRSFETTLTGDERLTALDVGDLTAALRGRGGQIEGRSSAAVPGRVTPPLVVGPLPERLQLSEAEQDLAVVGPDVKVALLFSGLYAAGPTYVRERVVSADHVVRLLGALEVPIATAGSVVELDPTGWSGALPGFSYDVVGDFSAAMVLLAAATMVQGSRVCVRGVGQNPTRTGALDILRSMGGAIDGEVHSVTHGEPEGTLCASFAPLRAATMAGETLVRGREDIAVLVALAARARGTTEISGIELAPADRTTLGELAAVLGRFGVVAEVMADGIIVHGMPDVALRRAEIDARGEAAVAISATLLALAGDGPSLIGGADALARRMPRFVGTLRALGAEVHVEPRTE